MKYPKFSHLNILKTAIAILILVTSSQVFSQENSLTPQQYSDGWRLLFNGTDMSKWRNFKQQGLNNKWIVEQGEMKLTGKGGGDILTKRKYQNFDLHLEWKISQAGNSGIFIMADELGDKIYSHAVEVQILDNERHPDNKEASHLSGSVYDMFASPPPSHKTAGQWNQVRILLNNKVLNVWQNNVLITTVLIGGLQWNQALAESKVKEWSGFALSGNGHIGLQDHNDPVAFKNIRIKEL